MNTLFPISFVFFALLFFAIPASAQNPSHFSPNTRDSDTILSRKKVELFTDPAITAPEYGPFFLPVSPSLNAVKICYYTDKPSKTKLFFSMVGDIDWARSGHGVSTYHEMIFDRLEENTTYTFEIDKASPKLSRFSSIKTPPYGNRYSFNFSFAFFGEPIPSHTLPNFLILLSSASNFTKDSFQKYYQENSKFLSSTVIVPAFDFNLDGDATSLSKGGLTMVSYGHYNFIVIHNNDATTHPINNYIASHPKGKNIFVMNNLDDTKVRFIINSYRHNALSFYISGTASSELNNIFGYTNIVINHPRKN